MHCAVYTWNTHLHGNRLTARKKNRTHVHVKHYRQTKAFSDRHTVSSDLPYDYTCFSFVFWYHTSGQHFSNRVTSHVFGTCKCVRGSRPTLRRATGGAGGHLICSKFPVSPKNSSLSLLELRYKVACVGSQYSPPQCLWRVCTGTQSM